MPLELEPYHQGVSDQELIDDLRRVANKVPRDQRITQNYYTDHGKYHACSFVRRFSGWLSALKKAGIETTRTYAIPVDELFVNLYEVWLRLGRQPYSTEMRRPLSRHGLGPYKRAFGGSYRRALREFVKWANEAESPPANLPVLVQASEKAIDEQLATYRGDYEHWCCCEMVRCAAYAELRHRTERNLR